jgi:hypothetical protein
MPSRQNHVLFHTAGVAVGHFIPFPLRYATIGFCQQAVKHVEANGNLVNDLTLWITLNPLTWYL